MRVQNKSLFIYSVTFFIAACFASTLALQGEPGKNPCKADVEKFCKDLKVGQGVRSCLKKHESELSPECKAARTEHEAFRHACKDDMKTLCKGKEGKDRYKCLKENSAKLSPACQAQMTKH